MKTYSLLLVFLLIPVCVHADIDQASIDQAIKAGVRYLKRLQQNSGAFPGQDGITILTLLALLKSRVVPQDPAIRKGLAYVYKHTPRDVYGTSLLIMLLEAAYAKYPHRYTPTSHILPKKIKRRIKTTVRRLMSGRGANGAYWSYNLRLTRGGDLSNAQFAILALKSASRCGIKIPPRYWRRMLVYLLAAQQKSGPAVSIIGGWAKKRSRYVYRSDRPFRARGWGYTLKSKKAYGSMTAAGLSSVMIAQSELKGYKYFSPDLQKRTQKAIDDGFAWLSHYYTIAGNPSGNKHRQNWHYYYLYGLERVGRLRGFDYIGTHRWYPQGAALLLEAQKADGRWKTGVRDTCFALLFLSQATAPLQGTITLRSTITPMGATPKPSPQTAETVTVVSKKPSRIVIPKEHPAALVNLYLKTTQEQKGAAILRKLQAHKLNFQACQKILRDGRRLKSYLAGKIRFKKFTIYGKTVPCALFFPPQYDAKKKFPLLILLHGTRGAGIHQINRWMEMAGRYGVILAAPTMDFDYGWKGTAQERAIPITLAKKLPLVYAIDSKRVFLYGVSAGGHCAWEVAARYPDYFAGLISVASAPRLKNWYNLSNLQHVPVFAAVGEREDPLLRRNLRWAGREIKRKGGSFHYKVYADKGHCLPIYRDIKQVAQWIQRKKCQWFPKKVMFVLSDQHTRSHWVEVLRFKNKSRVFRQKLTGSSKHMLRRVPAKASSKIGRVKAHITRKNQMYIYTRNVRVLRIHILPQVVDVTRPVTIYFNHKKRYHGRVDFNIEHLLKTLRGTEDRQRLTYAYIDFKIP